MELFRKIKWYLRGKPMISYPGYHCGCCGRWINKSFEIPEYDSVGPDGDTWGLCPDNTGCQKIQE